MAIAAALLAALLAAPVVFAQSEDPAAEESRLRQSLSAAPDDFTLHFNLALALSLQQKDEEAEKEYRRTLELKPGLYEADLNLGTLLLRDRKPEAALPFLREASTAKPAEYRPAFLYAEALLGAGDPATAVTEYQAALTANPKSAAAELGLGRALLRQADLAGALTHLNAAAALDPRDHDALLELAEAFEKENNPDAAIAIYRGFPGNATVQQHMGNLLAASDRFAAAIPALESAVKSNPSTANRMALADAYRLNKQTAPALQQLQLALATEPASYDLRMMYGRMLRDARRLPQAVEQFSAATRLKPDSLQAWNDLAALLVAAGDYPGGLDALDHVRGLGRESAGNFFYRALSLDHLHQLKPARDAYRQFLEADSGKLPDQEFQARQRIRIIEDELKRR